MNKPYSNRYTLSAPDQQSNIHHLRPADPNIPLSQQLDKLFAGKKQASPKGGAALGTIMGFADSENRCGTIQPTERTNENQKSNNEKATFENEYRFFSSLCGENFSDYENNLSAAQLSRRENYRQMHVSAKYLRGMNTKILKDTAERIDYETGEIVEERKVRYTGVCSCRKYLSYGHSGVDIELYNDRARYGHLASCGRIWQCPVCSRNICMQREREIRHAWNYIVNLTGKNEKPTYTAVMMTLTFQHNRSDDLQDLVKRARDALRGFTASAKMKKLRKNGDLLGSIWALEVTWSYKNGWHPHFHVLLFYRSGTLKQSIRELSCLRKEWSKCLTKQELKGGNHAFNLTGRDISADNKNSRIEEYIAKFSEKAGVSLDEIEDKRKWATKNAEEILAKGERWGVANELVGASGKTGSSITLTEKISYTPWEILAILTAYEKGKTVNLKGAPSHKQAIRLWQTFNKAMYQRQQINWSRGLKDFVGLNDLTDEQLAERDEEFEHGYAPEILATIVWRDWSDFCHAVGSKAYLLEIAEKQGMDGIWHELERVLGRRVCRSADAERRQVANSQQASAKELAERRKNHHLHRAKLCEKIDQNSEKGESDIQENSRPNKLLFTKNGALYRIKAPETRRQRRERVRRNNLEDLLIPPKSSDELISRVFARLDAKYRIIRVA
ncbi:hypothetical protein SAMN04515647_3789 [Cohaesibacter sp. ES.047]|uniref:protein rep n=1 Tax=Cohaesibacter sp. ES.047 TaxID=1798205 RepID=UPI000BC0001C|nr:protein rep [Cohaesibacter sp. ES.047]SNY93492.1 hypothetical protein SAMN04515647_3789 [Cohaesibacter sp. ES.047]